MPLGAAMALGHLTAPSHPTAPTWSQPRPWATAMTPHGRSHGLRSWPWLDLGLLVSVGWGSGYTLLGPALGGGRDGPSVWSSPVTHLGD